MFGARSPRWRVVEDPNNPEKDAVVGPNGKIHASYGKASKAVAEAQRKNADDARRES